MAQFNQNYAVPYGNAGEFSGITKSGFGKFPNPFFDIASEYVPRNLMQVFEWAEYLYLTYGTYRSAARKVVRYFLTELELSDESEDDRERYEDLLDNTLHLLTQLADIGDDYMVYGNVFVSVYFPFDRLLICPTCGTNYHVEAIAYKFNFGNLTFSATCKKCGYNGEFTRKDIRSPDSSKVKLIRWNPKRIRLRVHDISGECEYFYEPEPRFVEKLREGNRFYLNRTPWDIIECCSQSGSNDQPLFKFDSDGIYHMKEATLAGLPIRGWAIPPIMPNFKLAYYIQILRRYDEAIALDYIVPFRVLYPEGAAAGGINTDPLQTMNMDVFMSAMAQMVRNKRANSVDLQIAPFKIGYELLGGEAATLAPKDNLAQAIDELLNAVGFPAELYRGSLSIQAFPVALRLFEQTWGSLVDGYNDLIQYIVNRISRYFGWSHIEAGLRAVTLADDIEQKALALQAAAGMDISKGTAYRMMGHDFLSEQAKVVEEQKEVMRLQQEAMEEQEAAQLAGGEDPSGGGPGGEAGATPGDVHSQAQEIARNLLFSVPDGLRRGELIKIKHSNPTLHALVIQAMDSLRQELARQGQAMMLQQGAQQAGMKVAGAGELPSALAVGLLVTGQVLDYTRSDMRKLASAVRRDIESGIYDEKTSPARRAFGFIYRRRMGWT